MEEKHELELDFGDLFRYLKRKILVLLLAALIGGVFGFVFTKVTAVPKYTANISVYLMIKQYEEGIVYSDYQISSQLVYDYQALIKCRTVADRVIEDLDLDMTPEQVADAITVDYETYSRVLTVTVTDSDPQRAADIANALGNQGNELVADMMRMGAIQLVDEAKVPDSGSVANPITRAVLFAAVAVVLTAGVLAVIRVLDDTIRSEADVQRYLGLSVLGIIPENAELTAAAKKPAAKPAASKASAARKEKR